MEPLDRTPAATDAQRMRLRGLIVLASEIIATYWPMRTFIHHNPLHGLESLPFAEAVKMACESLGGNGYLSNDQYRELFRSGRIEPHHLDLALEPFSLDTIAVTLGDRKLTHAELLRAHLLEGLTAPAPDVLESLVPLHPDRKLMEALVRHLASGSQPATSRERPGEIRPEDRATG